MLHVLIYSSLDVAEAYNQTLVYLLQQFEDDIYDNCLVTLMFVTLRVIPLIFLFLDVLKNEIGN